MLKRYWYFHGSLLSAPANIRSFTRWAKVSFESNSISMQTTTVVVKIHSNLSVKCDLFICTAKFKQRLTQSRLFLCTVQFSSLKTETERIQAEKDQLQAELLTCRIELDGLRVALSHVQNTNKALTSDKVHGVSLFSFTACGAVTGAVSLNARQPCINSAWSCAARWSACGPRWTPSRPCRGTLSSSPSHCRSVRRLKKIKVILGVPLELLFLPLQVKLELIRQAESFEQVKEILEEQVGEAGSPSADSSWASQVHHNQIAHLHMGPKKANFPSVLDPVGSQMLSVIIYCLGRKRFLPTPTGFLMDSEGFGPWPRICPLIQWP